MAEKENRKLTQLRGSSIDGMPNPDAGSPKGRSVANLLAGLSDEELDSLTFADQAVGPIADRLPDDEFSQDELDMMEHELRRAGRIDPTRPNGPPNGRYAAQLASRPTSAPRPLSGPQMPSQAVSRPVLFSALSAVLAPRLEGLSLKEFVDVMNEITDEVLEQLR